MTRSTREQSGGCVLSLGSIGVDVEMAVDEPPGIGKTVSANCFRRLGGGKAANVAMAAARLGAAATLFAHVGDDDLSDLALGALREHGVDLSGVKHVHGAQTGVATVTVMPDGKKGFVVKDQANSCWDESDARDVIAAIRQAPGDSVLVADCEIPVHVIENALGAARHLGIRVVLDPSPADRVTALLLSLADIVTPDAHEAQALTGIECKDVESALQAGTRLRQRGAAIACIKLADGGCVIVESRGAAHIASVPVDVVDSTGAGDAFAGALAVGLSRRMSCIEAARAAVAASTVAVTRFGAQPSYPSREELESMREKTTVTPLLSTPG